MKLPINTDMFGYEITIQEGELKDKLGQWDESTSTITIKSDQPEYDKHVIFIHEIMHMVEITLIDTGILKEHINPDFIEAASFSICALLTECGALNGFTKESIADFIREREKNNERK